MKKYLMIGFAALAFAACSNNDDSVYDPNRSAQGDKYEQAFADAFGKINPNVNWGFNAVKPINAEPAALTRSHNVNRNQWGSRKESDGISGQVKVPVNVTSDERNLVYNYFNQERREDKSVQVNWADYFISEVYKGTKTGVDGNGNTTDVLSNKMNHLQVRYGEGSIDADGNLVGAWEHANDFNNGNHNSTFGQIEGHTFMYSSGTLEFAYHNAIDSKYHNEYLIVPGEVIDPSLAGYYYVAFDFYATHPTGQEANKNMDVARDYYYTDWIVRISPAEFLNAQRVMVEDLIATNLSDVDKSDWDFNDAVFDVAFFNEQIGNEQKLVAHIALHAAGGTLNLTVGGTEVRQLFGDPVNTMVNTNAGAISSAAVDGLPTVTFIYVMGAADYTGTHTADEVPVFIGSTELKAETGKAPQKIVTDNDTRWMKEKTLITLGYESFAKYVVDNTPKKWYKAPEPINVSKLY